MNWAWEERSRLAELLGEHVILSLAPVLVGLLLAVPAAVVVERSPLARRPLLLLCSLLQAAPVLAYFVVLPGLLNTRLDDRANVLVALTLFVLVLLTRVIAAALAAVPGHVRHAADAMGMAPMARLVRVEFPVALPAVIAGVRSAALASIALVAVAAVIEVEGLGTLLTEGFTIGFETEVLVGIVLIVLLAAGTDVALVRAARLIAPWSRLVPVR